MRSVRHALCWHLLVDRRVPARASVAWSVADPGGDPRVPPFSLVQLLASRFDSMIVPVVQLSRVFQVNL